MGLVPRHVELQPGHMVLQYGHQGMWATPRRTVKLRTRPVFSAYTRKPQPSESVYLITGVGAEAEAYAGQQLQPGMSCQE